MPTESGGASGQNTGLPAGLKDPFEGAMCPSGFMPKEGTNTDFTSGNAKRQFVVVPPKTPMYEKAPVLVVLTGTVESTNDSLDGHSHWVSDISSKGWFLLGPVRACSTSPSDSSTSCNAAGTDGWNWRPWNEGAATGSAGMKWWNDEGPDARFIKEMVRCASTKWKLDSSRLFVTGISSGGTFTHRLLTFQSDFWAGGIPESGEWYVMPNNQAVMQMPEGIFNGRCCPLPTLPEKLGPMFVISGWGGDSDMWMGLSDYRPTTQAASNYFSKQPDVVHVGCSDNHGHMWQQVPGFNAWAADLLYAHPKGSTIAPNNTSAYKLPSPAPGTYKCVVGRYTDHYK